MVHCNRVPTWRWSDNRNDRNILVTKLPHSSVGRGTISYRALRHNVMRHSTCGHPAVLCTCCVSFCRHHFLITDVPRRHAPVCKILCIYFDPNYKSFLIWIQTQFTYYIVLCHFMKIWLLSVAKHSHHCVHLLIMIWCELELSSRHSVCMSTHVCALVTVHTHKVGALAYLGTLLPHLNHLTVSIFPGSDWTIFVFNIIAVNMSSWVDFSELSKCNAYYEGDIVDIRISAHGPIINEDTHWFRYGNCEVSRHHHTTMEEDEILNGDVSFYIAAMTQFKELIQQAGGQRGISELSQR